MALIKCPECGREVSDKALSCPTCGFPISHAVPAEPSAPAPDEAAPAETISNGAASPASKTSAKTATAKDASVKRTIIAVTVVLAVLIVAVVSLYAPRSGPSVNDNNVLVGKRVLNAVDEYLDGDCSASAAARVVEAAYDDIDEDDTVASSVDLLGFQTSMLCLKVEFSSLGADASEIKQYRNEIADFIGEAAYK